MTASGSVLEGRALCAGAGQGDLLVLDAPLSFWGGVDRRTGVIIDVHHPQVGQSVAGRVLALPSGRGSSSSTSVLAELIRIDRGPAAIVLSEPDVIIVLAGLVATELYGKACPIVELEAATYVRLRGRAGLAIVEAEADRARVRIGA
jgi:predicted aconitase with swiveling domain